MSATIRQQLQQASAVIKDGGVVAYPTESCFGLGCNPKDSKALTRILKLKRRATAKGLILIGNDYLQLKPFVNEIPTTLEKKMLNSWPAAITWLVPVASWVPNWIKGDSDKIAIRIPNHNIARELCRYCDHALISTSANLSGQQACRTSKQVKQKFVDNIDYIIDASCGSSLHPSTIIDIETNQKIR